MTSCARSQRRPETRPTATTRAGLRPPVLRTSSSARKHRQCKRTVPMGTRAEQLYAAFVAGEEHWGWIFPGIIKTLK